MRLPSLLKDLLPSESVKQWMDLVSQPNLVAGLKDAAQQLGWKEGWGTPQLQHSILQARKWLEMFQDRWREGNQGRLQLGINATGVVLSSKWSAVPLASSAISMQAYLASGFSRPDALGDDLQKTIHSLTGAEACLVTPNLEQAVLAVASVLEPGLQWALPRADSIRLAGGVDLAQLLSFHRSGLIEIGAANSCSTADWIQAAGRPVGGFFHVAPSRLPSSFTADERTQLGETKNSLGQSIASVELLLDGSLIDLAPLGLHVSHAAERLRLGADAVILPGHGWIGGPECGIVVGSTKFMERVQSLAASLGLKAGPATTATLHASILAGSDTAAWRETPLGATIGNGIDNLVHRAKRLALQLDGLPGIASVESGRATFALADSPLENVKLDSGYVRLKFQTVPAKEARQKLAAAATPLWCLADGDELTIVMRSVDPADDNEIVQAFEANFKS